MNALKMYVIYALMCIFLFSCQKNEVPTPTPHDEVIYEASGSDPFEQFGISHNARMDYVAANTNFSTLTTQQLAAYGQTYSDSYFAGSSSSWANHQDFMALMHYLVSYPEDAIDEALLINVIEPEEEELASMLFHLISNAVDEPNETYLSISAFQEEVEEIEDYINQYYEVNYDEETYEDGNVGAKYLAACSIAKASYEYWVTVVNSTSHPWKSRFDNNKTYTNVVNFKNGEIQNRSFWGAIARAIKTAGADVWGFIACETCGRATEGGYNLSQAWDNAGDASETAGENHDKKYGKP